jgi:TPR repeat protein
MRLFFLFLFSFSFLFSDTFSIGLKYYKQKSYNQAYSEFLKCKKDKDCQAMIGLMNQKGEGVSKNIQVAKEWYEKSANQGELSSMHNLGILYLNEKKYKLARKYFMKARKNILDGYTPSIYNLGLIYLYGWGVKPDYEKSLQYMNEAHVLGYKDADKVIRWLKKQLKNK